MSGGLKRVPEPTVDDHRANVVEAIQLLKNEISNLRGKEESVALSYSFAHVERAEEWFGKHCRTAQTKESE
jgi:hypothetical protein